MGPVVKVTSPSAPAGLDRPATVQVTLANTSAVVEAYDIEVLGEAAAWAKVQVGFPRLLPGETGTATIVFAPTPATPAGTWPFGVAVTGRSDPLARTVEEGHIEVEGAVAVSLEVRPRTAEARRRATPAVIVRNGGNKAARVTLEAWEADDVLQLRLDQDEVDVPALAEVAVGLGVVAVQRNRERGPVLRAYEVRASTGSTTATTDAALRQPGRRGRLLPLLAIAAVIALVVGLLVLRGGDTAETLAGQRASDNALDGSSTTGSAPGTSATVGPSSVVDPAATTEPTKTSPSSVTNSTSHPPPPPPPTEPQRCSIPQATFGPSTPESGTHTAFVDRADVAPWPAILSVYPLANDRRPTGTTPLVQSVTGADQGTALVSSDRTVVIFAPSEGSFGVDELAYTTTVGTTATIIIEVKNLAPATSTQKVCADRSAVLVSTLGSNTSQGKLRVSAVSRAAKGAVTVRSDGVEVMYTPNPGATGNDLFTYSLQDGGTSSATGAIAVNIVR